MRVITIFSALLPSLSLFSTPGWQKAVCPFAATQVLTADEARLAEVADQIALSNPEVFGGRLPSKQLCFKVENSGCFDEENMPCVSAMANLRAEDLGGIYPKATLLISSFLMQAMRERSHLASVVAHELAHFALDHDQAVLGTAASPWAPIAAELVAVETSLDYLWDEKAALVWKLGRGDMMPPEEDQLIKAIEDIEVRLEAYRPKIHDQVRQLRDQIRALQESVYSPEYLANWVEQQADEVGRIFYLKAGFPAHEYTWLQEREVAISLSSDKRDAKNVEEIWRNPSLDPLQLLKQCNGPDYWSEPERGTWGHPKACWRLWNLLHQPQLSSNL